MFTRTDSGLYKPRTLEEDKELEMLTLSASLIKADYVSSISQVLSPRRGKELTGLAKILRNTAEPHVRTNIPDDMTVRPYKSADRHLYIQAGLKVELMYAYILLYAGESDDKQRAEYAEEAQRLEKEILKDVFQDKNMFIHAALAYKMRSATIHYFRAAWNFLNNENPSVTKNYLDNALLIYENVKKLLIKTDCDEAREFTATVAINGIDKISKIANVYAEKEVKSLEEKIKWTAEGIDELISMLVSDQFRGLRQDVLFGEMKCYALQGRSRKFRKTASELAKIVMNEENRPAQVITSSCVVMMDDAMKNSKWKGLKLNPFVSDSPKILLDAVEHIEESFGKTSSKLWKPGDELKPPVILP